MSAQPSAGSARARALGRACVVVGLVCGLTALVPFSPTAPRSLAVVLSLVAVTLGAVLLRHSERVTAGHTHAVLGLATLLVTLCVARSTTAAGTAVTAVSYTWIAVYSAAFHDRRALALHLSAIGAGMVTGLVLAGAQSPGQTWMFLMATIGTVAWVLNERVSGLSSAAALDPLTGLLSRRGLAHEAGREMARAARTGEPLVLAAIDLDDFKEVNDRAGHAAGDALLVGIAGAWRAALRPADVLGRHGGDEFLLVLPATDESGAGAVLERLRALPDTCSWSVGTARWDGEPLEAWISRADAALYADKAARRSPDRREPPRTGT